MSSLNATMISAIHRKTFRDGSRTYHTSSLLFPAPIRRDVAILYGFVRTADNFVDAIPQDVTGFEAFCERYERSLRGEATGDEIIDSFRELSLRRTFDSAWTTAFLKSMRMDTEKSVYTSLDETLEYIYGSAEVIGLYMCRILDIPSSAYHAAQMLGRAMQFINFIRDIHEDVRLGRTYLPLSETTLPSLSEDEARKDPDEFRSFISRQLDRYRKWQREAEDGYDAIPWRLRVPIHTAGEMYKWTGTVIADDPFIVYNKKVKPGRGRILSYGVRSLLRSFF